MTAGAEALGILRETWAWGFREAWSGGEESTQEMRQPQKHQLQEKRRQGLFIC